MTLNRYVLGYDLRACANDYLDREWSAERRSKYLLKSDVSWPLSVDTAVWPSLFGFTSRRADYRPVETIDVDPSSTRQRVLRLWERPEDIEKTLREKKAYPKCFVMIAVELLADTDLVAEPHWQSIADLFRHAANTDFPFSKWKLVGYDVADGDLVSGIMNCSYEGNDSDKTDQWSKNLNEFGLFDDLERAKEFRVHVEKRIPDHAPFHIYRLHADLMGATQ